MQSTSSSCQILTKFEFSSQIFEKCSNTKLLENPSRGSRIVPCGRTDMTNLMPSFRNFVISPNKLRCPPAEVLLFLRCYSCFAEESQNTRSKNIQ